MVASRRGRGPREPPGPAFAFWLPILPGALDFASLRRTVTRWAAQDAGRPRVRRRRFARPGRPALARAE